MTDIKFDQTLAEVVVHEELVELLGGSVEIFDSSATGVVAFERLYNEQKVDWDAFAAKVGEKLGFKVLCVANCDWSFDDRCDEEAIFVAFDVPGLDPDYVELGRNKLTVPDDVTAPSP